MACLRGIRRPYEASICFQNPLGDVHGALEGDALAAWQQELFSAISRRQVIGPSIPVHRLLRRARQRLVAGGVTVAIVYGFEMVQVGENYAQVFAQPFRASYFPRERLGQRPAIGESGERVGAGQPLDRFIGRLQFPVLLRGLPHHHG